MGSAPWVRRLIEQKAGVPVDREAIRQSIRRLYETHLFETIDVVSEPAGAGEIALIFRTTPRYFIGLLTVDGLPKNGPRSSEMINAATLELGLPYSPERLKDSLERMHRVLQESGYYQSRITYVENPDPATQQMNIAFHVEPGAVTRIGQVTLAGNPDMPVESVEDMARLHPGNYVRKGEVQRALRRLRKHYQKDKRLEAHVAIARSYNEPGNTVDYTIEVHPGPAVEIMAQGARVSSGQMKKQVPIYQEGAVDEDLLNEGRRNLREFLQSEGYFDAEVSVQQRREDDSVKILYGIERGPRHRLVNIKIEGAKYFDQETLRERMSSQTVGRPFQKGRFSPSILAGDVSAIKTLYQANGFPDVRGHQQHPRELPGRPAEAAGGNQHCRRSAGAGAEPRHHGQSDVSRGAVAAGPVQRPRATLLGSQCGHGS